jgi:hypothetical protein
MKRTFLVLCVLLVGIGCSTSKNKIYETIREYDSAGNLTTETITKGGSCAKVGMMLKADRMAQDWTYTWGGTENQIAFGASGTGYDSTAQVEAVKAVSSVIQPILDAIAKAVVDAAISYLTTPAVSAADVVVPNIMPTNPLSSLILNNPFIRKVP